VGGDVKMTISKIKADVLNLVNKTSDPSGTEGQVIYNSTDKKIKLFDGSSWGDVGGGAGSWLSKFQDNVLEYDTGTVALNGGSPSVGNNMLSYGWSAMSGGSGSKTALYQNTTTRTGSLGQGFTGDDLFGIYFPFTTTTNKIRLKGWIYPNASGTCYVGVKDSSSADTTVTAGPVICLEYVYNSTMKFQLRNSGGTVDIESNLGWAYTSWVYYEIEIDMVEETARILVSTSDGNASPTGTFGAILDLSGQTFGTPSKAVFGGDATADHTWYMDDIYLQEFEYTTYDDFNSYPISLKWAGSSLWTLTTSGLGDRGVDIIATGSDYRGKGKSGCTGKECNLYARNGSNTNTAGQYDLKTASLPTGKSAYFFKGGWWIGRSSVQNSKGQVYAVINSVNYLLVNDDYAGTASSTAFNGQASTRENSLIIFKEADDTYTGVWGGGKILVKGLSSVTDFGLHCTGASCSGGLGCSADAIIGDVRWLE